MKVKDVMTAHPLSIDESAPIKKLTHLIFTSNTPGFPVIRGKKVIGFIAEEDIFLKTQESCGDKQVDEKFLATILEKPVKDFMSKGVVSVTPDTELIDAQLLLYKRNFFQLPVVNKEGELVGALSRGDVFRYVIEEELPELEQSQYVSFIQENYDQMIDWQQRFDFEFPTLFRIFERDLKEKILDVGVWTGEYSIGLAKEGVTVTGIDHNPNLVAFANAKRAKLSEKLKKQISFQQTDYKDLVKQFGAGSFGGVICLGGSLPYLPIEPEVLFKSAHTLLKKKGVFVLQLQNLERVMEHRKRLLYFKIKKSESGNEKEELNVEYFDKKNEDTLIQNIVTFTSDGKRWIYRGINSIDIKYIKCEKMEALVKKAGFKEINVTGNKGEEEGQYGHMSIVKPFDPVTSEWMTIIARK